LDIWTSRVFIFWMDVIANYGKLNDHDQDYAWVQRGMIFPFMDFLDRCVTCHCFCCRIGW
jgi:hypothetical protein